uniref:Uncharacterized protein n=1 Tax=Timema poppense TaxID=170557 RepID=A0A7R9HCP5_TIMPO|nr:unnamed protein product [Timema poppensis]
MARMLEMEQALLLDETTAKVKIRRKTLPGRRWLLLLLLPLGSLLYILNIPTPNIHVHLPGGLPPSNYHTP